MAALALFLLLELPYSTFQHCARDSSALKICLEESRSPSPKANRPTGVQSG